MSLNMIRQRVRYNDQDLGTALADREELLERVDALLRQAMDQDVLLEEIARLDEALSQAQSQLKALQVLL